jgi:hypothetical protein
MIACKLQFFLLSIENNMENIETAGEAVSFPSKMYEVELIKLP